MTRSVLTGIVALALFASACSSGADDAASDPTEADGSAAADGAESGLVDASEPVPVPALQVGEAIDYGPAPDVPDGPIDPELEGLIDELGSSLSLGLSAVTIGLDAEKLDRMVAIGDPRFLWVLADLLRFPLEGVVASPQVIRAFQDLSGIALQPSNPWVSATNPLIAWDLPAPEGYLGFKRTLFTTLEPRWEPLFDDAATIDWRHVGWGGVLIDDRIEGGAEGCPRGCIPALDDPVVTDAAGGSWYPDDAVVFGIVVDGEARAYPKNIMEIHEMVNDTLGGRRIALPYCTLCGSAQAYFTDELPPGTLPEDELPIFRTSGLLVRSNKMMFELRTLSFVDTFLGNATSGPLLEAEANFAQAGVVTSTWGRWKADHPDTTIVAEDGGIGRSYPLDPLRGRDDNGPIFPIGDVDPRLAVQEQVLGIETSDGTPVAVHVAIARATLQNGDPIEFEGVTIQLDGDGIRAVGPDGNDLGSHQAFWFAWSQFRPDTLVWPTDFVS